LTDPPTIIRDNQSLFSYYQQLKKNDIICGRIRLSVGEEHLLIDLLDRGIRLIPSATSQLASRSKTFQARIFSDFMLPGTLPIYDRHALLQASSTYQQRRYTKVILKCDRKNAGLGVHVFSSIEYLYNQVCGGNAFSFPFVIQPFQTNSRDIRVIIFGDYIEAYERINPYNFRKNLHCGGQSVPYVLPENQLEMCRKVMRRGEFPYAHLDLMLTADGECRLMEINLKGGLRGARISSHDYRACLAAIHEKLVAQLCNDKDPATIG
jgi:glutathione synthase/RimK-type ligase-like ATP-grasp enzyme